VTCRDNDNGVTKLRRACDARSLARNFLTHHFKLDKILDAYDTFGRAASTRALKVLIEA
jgi:alcohol dehydrogenase